MPYQVQMLKSQPSELMNNYKILYALTKGHGDILILQEKSNGYFPLLTTYSVEEDSGYILNDLPREIIFKKIS